MERLLRTLFTLRGLILAATLTLAALGGYLDRGTVLPVAKVKSQLAPQVHAMDRSQVLSQWRVGDPCPPVSTPESAPACW
jgi:hypothetical protein